jgi:hypothetical protein
MERVLQKTGCKPGDFVFIYDARLRGLIWNTGVRGEDKVLAVVDTLETHFKKGKAFAS